MHSAVLASKSPLTSRRYHCGPCTSSSAIFRSVSGLSCRPSRRPVVTVQAANNNLDEKVDETTKKYGLEAGLWEVFSSKDADGKSKTETAKDLLKRYGSAYLITSISFAIVSFAACYALVASGVDVAALLSKVGLKVTDTSERVGTFAIAYAAHKALSPVRFPPTVALTPVMARWLGKDVQSSTSSLESSADAE